MKTFRPFLAAALAVAAVSVPVRADRDHKGDGRRTREPRPLVIGHRGSPGYMPEHTLASYALAIELGADYVEPDLVMTRDGQLIARHEPNLTATTDVSTRPEFAARKTTKVVDGFAEQGWFASDFTLAEIRTLRAVQTMPGERYVGLDGLFTIPTFREVIQLAKRKSDEKGRTIGVYPETKHPTYHRELGLPLENAIVRVLRSEGWDDDKAPVFIQSFEQANLKYLNTITDVRLVQLVDGDGVDADGNVTFAAPFDRPYDWTRAGRLDFFGYLTTPQGLAEVATYADGIGPWKPYLLRAVFQDAGHDGQPDDLNGDGAIDDRDRVVAGPTDVIEDAHQRGLLVHTWTFRSEPRRLASTFIGSPAHEYRAYYEAGIDGVFADFSDDAYAARVQFLLRGDPRLVSCLTGGFNSRRCEDIAP